MRNELGRKTQLAQRGIHTSRTHFLADARTHAAGTHAVLNGHHNAVITSQLNNRRRHRHHPARVNHGGLDTLGGKHLRSFQSHASHSAHGNEQYVTLTGLRVGLTGACQHVHTVTATLQGGNVLAHGALRVTNHGRCIVDSYSLTQLFAQGRAITRSRQVQTRNELQHRQIPHAVVACAVRAGNAGAVQHHGHARLVQGNVHEQLVKAAVEEGCVEGNHRVHAAVRQAGAHRHSVLLSDTHVNNALGVALLEFAQTHGNEHRAGNTDDVLLLIRNICDFATKDTGPRLGGAGRNILTGQRVNLAHRMELVVLIRAGGRVAVALLGNSVHNHRAGVVLRRGQCVLHSLLVVAVNGAHILHAQVFKNALGYDDVLNARLHAVQAAVHHLTDRAATLQTDAHRIQGVVVAVIEAHTIHLLLHTVLELRELVRETANGRRVGAAVIVDHNHDLAGAVGSDIVHCLPRHAAGQRAVANENHGVAVIFTVELVRARNTVSPRNRAGGVRRSNNVVLRLATIRVTRQATLLTQSLKRVTTSHQLMHIGLVAGVEKNVVLGRFEDTVNTEGQLHNAQVRTQVTAGRRHVRHDELADFLRELLQLLVAEVLQVRRGLNTREQLGSGTIANAVVGGGCATGGAIRGLLLRQCVFSGHTPTLLKVGARLIPCVGSSMILPFTVPKSRFMRPQSKTHRVERKRPEITPSGQAGEQPNPSNTAIICFFVTATSRTTWCGGGADEASPGHAQKAPPTPRDAYSGTYQTPEAAPYPNPAHAKYRCHDPGMPGRTPRTEYAWGPAHPGVPGWFDSRPHGTGQGPPHQWRGFHQTQGRSSNPPGGVPRHRESPQCGCSPSSRCGSNHPAQSSSGHPYGSPGSPQC